MASETNCSQPFHEVPQGKGIKKKKKKAKKGRKTERKKERKGKRKEGEKTPQRHMVTGKYFLLLYLSFVFVFFLFLIFA